MDANAPAQNEGPFFMVAPPKTTVGMRVSASLLALAACVVP